jgi:hypothetical protein
MPRFLLSFVTFAFCATVAVADPVISEFMASNHNSISDEDGNHSDWIEIYNPDVTAVNMAGWSLTDLQSNLQKWTFPAVTIPAKGHLLVFASGQDRKVVGQPLHTSFDLKASGEYLALVKPDGSTITTEFAPVYPPQFEDISYGTSQATTDLILIDKATACRAFCPADNSLGFTWRQSGFDDSTWTAGTFAVGYFTTAANPNFSADLGVNLASGMSGDRPQLIFTRDLQHHERVADPEADAADELRRWVRRIHQWYTHGVFAKCARREHADVQHPGGESRTGHLRGL